MPTKSNLRKWVLRHKDKHLCLCGCGFFIEIKPIHYKRGIPKFIKGHNFYGEHNPKTGPEIKVERKSPRWEVLSEEEKERRISNLNKFGRMEEHPNWVGGRIENDAGYIMVRCPEHPFNRDGYVLEHRLVMENFLREKYPGSPYLTFIKNELYLRQDVFVHHIEEGDENKSKNVVENLFPMTPAEHAFWHGSKLPNKEKIEVIKSGKYRNLGEDKPK